LLAAEGAAVVVNDVAESADEVAAAIQAAGGRAVAHRCSVSDWAAAEGLVQRAVDEFGDLHVLVNNAGFIRDAISFSMDEAFDCRGRRAPEGPFRAGSFRGGLLAGAGQGDPGARR
jgi:NAD(P)-dependent dehydrogenase (short-subunit alcohol dehydrogenase family)